MQIVHCYAIGYIATENIIANSHFYNAFGLVPPDNITALLINYKLNRY
jgi:hypothetical protein